MRMSANPALFDVVLEVLSSATGQEKRDKRHKTGGKGGKLSLFTDNVSVSIEKLNGSKHLLKMSLARLLDVR